MWEWERGVHCKDVFKTSFVVNTGFQAVHIYLCGSALLNHVNSSAIVRADCWFHNICQSKTYSICPALNWSSELGNDILTKNRYTA